MRTSRRIFRAAVAVSLALVLSVFSLPALAAGSGPDLIVPSITLSPANPTLGDTVTITVTVKNQGTATAGSSRVAYYLDDELQSYAEVNSLSAGNTASKNFGLTAQPGSHTIRAVADADASVTESDETNNTKSVIFFTLGPDLIVSSITWTPTDPSRGDNITISVNIKNQGSATSRATRVSLDIDGSSRGYQDIPTISAGGTATRTYSWVAAAGQHSLEAAVDELNTIQEYDESNNALMVTFSTLTPDLIIQTLAWSPQNPSIGQSVSFNATIKNQGAGRADACHLAYSFDKTPWGTQYVNALDAGESVNATFTWTPLSDVRNLEVSVTIDSYNRIAESDESNNQLTTAFLTLLPDLIIQNITWSPGDAAVGDNVTFAVTIRNQGAGRSGTCLLAYYIGSQVASFANIAAVNAGATTNLTFIWQATPGEHDISVAADANNIIAESKEDNNRKTVKMTVLPPDLVIKDITWLPENPSVGDTVTFTVTTKNQGSGVATGFRIACFVDGTPLNTDYISGLAAGVSANTTFTWQMGASQVIKAVADTTNAVFEIDENNNTTEVIAAAIMPDLVIDKITWSPADFSAGGTVTFAISLKNQGRDRAGPSLVTYYADGATAGYQDVPEMASGAYFDATFTWKAAAGAHIIRVTADSGSQVTESDETNNVNTVNIPPPDLIVLEAACSPAEAVIGETVAITATLKNQGSGQAGDSRLTFNIDGAVAGYQDVTEIAAGATSSATFVWKATAGIHTIKITADAGNRVTESDEANNERVISFATLTPDLVLQDIVWSMENPLISDNATFAISVKNQGLAPAGRCRLIYYLDDSPAGYQDMPDIAKGASLTASFITPVRKGTHTVRAVIDAGNEVAETDEANNQKSMTFSTMLPDLLIRDIAISPPEPAAGEKATITVKVKNQGSVKAANARVALNLDGTLLETRDIAEIDTGATEALSYTWTAEAATHEVSAVADPDGTMMESNEFNNTRVLVLQPPAAAGQASPAADSSSAGAKGSFWDNMWWLLCIVAVIAGGLAFLAAMKSFKK